MSSRPWTYAFRSPYESVVMGAEILPAPRMKDLNETAEPMCTAEITDMAFSEGEHAE